ncbi:hypothetical protein [Corynebacterium propinquum]
MKCPVCEQNVGFVRIAGVLNIHDDPATGRQCSSLKDTYQFLIVKQVPSKTATKPPQQASKRRLSYEEKQRRGRDRYMDSQERKQDRSRHRTHWREEYAIYAEDSWGKDDLGPEGGINSVRARSGGSVQSNRRRY